MRVWKVLIIVGLVAVLCRAAALLFLVIPSADVLGFGGGDGAGYHRLGISLLQTKQFSDPLFLARPPLFPLLISLTYATVGIHPHAVIIVNAALSSLVAVLTVLLVIKLGFSLRAGFGAGLLVAIDPISVYYGVAPLAEPLLDFLLIVGLLFLVHFCVLRPVRVTVAIGQGLSLGLAMLTKPVAILYWVVPVCVLGFFWRRWREATIVGLLSCVFLIGWIAHNMVVWNVPVFSSAGEWNMLFIRGVGVLRRVTGDSPEVIEQKLIAEIEKRVGNVPSELPSRYYYLETTDPRRLAVMRTLALEIYIQHPGWYLAMIPVGLFRMYFLSRFSGACSFFIGLFNLVVYLAACLGVQRLWKVGRRDIVFVIVTTVVYFSAVTVTAQTAAMDARFRLPFFPLLALAVFAEPSNLFFGKSLKDTDS